MSTTEIPTRQQLVQQARDLVPLLRSRSDWHTEHRGLHEETIEALADAGVFRLRVPARYGGYEADTRTLVDVATELGRGDGASAWVASVYWIPGWMVGMFPDAVQDEIYSTPNVRICGTLSPSATAKQTNDGIVVNGKWGFISGARHAHWQEIIAILIPEQGEPYPVMGLVPLSDLQIVDDWHTVGLHGTGSVSTLAQDVFIPQERVMPMNMVQDGQTASPRNARIPLFNTKLQPVAAASSVGAILGMAKAAQENFLERLPHRRITYTAYESAREAPVTHLQVAEATLKIEQAEFHAYRVADAVDSKCQDGTPWKLEERARARVDVGAVSELSIKAVDVLAAASGGSSIYRTVPIQQILHDLQALNLHSLINAATAVELYGRVLCGLETNTPYI